MILSRVSNTVGSSELLLTPADRINIISSSTFAFARVLLIRGTCGAVWMCGCGGMAVREWGCRLIVMKWYFVIGVIMMIAIIVIFIIVVLIVF